MKEQYNRFKTERATYIRLHAAASGLLCLLTALGFAGFHLQGIVFEQASLLSINVVLGAPLFALSFVYTLIRFDRTLASLLGSSAIMLLSAPVLCMLTYVFTGFSSSMPLADALFAEADRRLGFDWPAMIAFLNARPLLARLAYEVYGSIVLQAGLCLVVLVATGQHARLTLVLIAFMIGGAVTSVVAGLLPAHGAYAFHGLTPADHSAFPVSVDAGQAAIVDSLRQWRFPLFGTGTAEGIISFPSFHATLAVLFAWGLAATRWLRWPMLALNLAMLAATPAQGAHYLVDVIAGVAVGVFAVAMALRVRRAIEPAGANMPVPAVPVYATSLSGGASA